MLNFNQQRTLEALFVVFAAFFFFGLQISYKLFGKIPFHWLVGAGLVWVAYNINKGRLR